MKINKKEIQFYSLNVPNGMAQKQYLNVVAHIPVRVPSYSPCQLNVPGLEGHLPGMDC